MRYLLIPLILLTACAPQDCVIPNCNCPTNPECDPVIINQTQECPSNIDVYFIDVGQGDATLIKHGNTEFLIDCGRDDTASRFLNRMDIDHLEYMLLSHPDEDHIGGCKEIIETIDTKVVITNGEKKDTMVYRDLMEVVDQHIIASEGDSWNIGPAKLKVIQILNTDNSNHNSIVARLVYDQTEVLFTGDCDRSCETELLDENIEADILKVGHHGSKYATKINFLELVDPDVAVISVGENTYGHPTQEVLDRLSQENIIYYRTDKEGTIHIELTADGFGEK